MFLTEPPPSEERDAVYERDLSEDGYVHNHTRLWAWSPGLFDAFAELRARLMDSSSLTDRDWALLVVGTTSQLEDSYCPYAWAARLAEVTDLDTANQVLSRGSPPSLSERERALLEWSRSVVADPNRTTPEDIDRLRDTGLTDQEIFEATAFISFRLALAVVNDALGAAPDREIVEKLPDQLKDAVVYGRRPQGATGITR